MTVRGATNPRMARLVERLKTHSREKKAGLWKRVAECLCAPTRKRVVVNISKLERFSENGETVVVPGKVLGSGVLTKKVNVAAFGYSRSAKDKISKAGGSCAFIEDLLEKNPEGKGLKIMK